MHPIQLFDPASSTYTYVLVDEGTREALIIDPVDDQLARDLAVLREGNLKLVWTIETHAHADHITSAGLLAEHAGARTAAPEGCGIGTAAVQLKDGDMLNFGNEQLKALHTPGHTGGSMSYLWRGNVFSGDTLLINGCGRTDFQSGSAAALYRSVTEVLFALPEATIVWPAHDYQGRGHTTIAREKAVNARGMRPSSKANWVTRSCAFNAMSHWPWLSSTTDHRARISASSPVRPRRRAPFNNSSKAGVRSSVGRARDFPISPPNLRRRKIRNTFRSSRPTAPITSAGICRAFCTRRLCSRMK